MKNKASIWCYISGVVAYIAGIIYCLSLIFIPIGIYCIIFGMRYFSVAKITDSEFATAKMYLFGPTIGLSIFAFPIGLVSLIPYFMAGNNNVKVNNTATSADFREEPAEGETVRVEVDTVTIPKEQSKTSELSSEDLEKLEKLANFKNQGLLTEEEYEQAKNQIINK